ncbi:hypothetical protein EfmAA96_26180 [Enterococcus faecium]|nr:hypothetical protein EfmAA96_26180 [Enterococcus faecium]
METGKQLYREEDGPNLGSIIYGTDESELILQPHFHFRYVKTAFSSMIKSPQNKQLRGRYAIMLDIKLLLY